MGWWVDVTHFSTAAVHPAAYRLLRRYQVRSGVSAKRSRTRCVLTVAIFDVENTGNHLQEVREVSGNLCQRSKGVDLTYFKRVMLSEDSFSFLRNCLLVFHTLTSSVFADGLALAHERERVKKYHGSMCAEYQH